MGSFNCTVAIALSEAEPPVTVASAAPSPAVRLMLVAARLTPSVIVPGWMKKPGVAPVEPPVS